MKQATKLVKDAGAAGAAVAGGAGAGEAGADARTSAGAPTVGAGDAAAASATGGAGDGYTSSDESIRQMIHDEIVAILVLHDQRRKQARSVETSDADQSSGQGQGLQAHTWMICPWEAN